MTTFLMLLISMFQTYTSQIIWENTIIQIPLYENADDYRFLPKASLYIHGKETIDPLMYYETNGVERTFFHTVNTSAVKTYTIKYRVHFPTYMMVHTQSITFHVVDLIPPEITKIPEFRIPLGSKLPDLKDGLSYKDNYDSDSDLKVSVNSSNVILNKIGRYEIYYSIRDLSSNLTEGIGYLEVYDAIAPEITLKKPIILPFGSKLDIYQFFTIKDNYDSYLLIEIKDSLVNYNQIGSYMITIIATDRSGNKTLVTEPISIVDIKPPVIVATTKPKPIPVYHQATTNELLENIIYVSDDVDDLSIFDIRVEHLIEFDVIGTYDVFYILSDHSSNTTTIKLKVSVVDFEKPIITLLHELTFDVFSPLPFFENLISYEDNYTKTHDLKLKITHFVKMNVIGSYPITFSVTDLSSNTRNLNALVHIVDQIPPEIIQNSEMIVTDFTKKSFIQYFSVTDQYDSPSKIKIHMDDSKVNYEKIGFYACEVKACDQSQNCSILNTYIMVFDITDPIIVLSNTNVYLKIGEEIPNLYDFILSVTDNYDPLSIFDVVIISDIKPNVIGKYEVIYQVFDQSNNKSEAKIYFFIDDYKRPSLILSDLFITQYQKIDLLEGVEVIDEDKHVDIYTFPKAIDTTKPGSVVVTYVIIDQRGNYNTYDRIIHIMNEKTAIPFKDYLPMVGVITLGISLILYFIKREKGHLF